MNRLTRLLAATACLFMSGLLYTLERIATFTRWNAQVATGTFPSEPLIVDVLLQNVFISIFGVAAIILFFMAGNAAQHTTSTNTGTADL
ncbi:MULTISPECIES: hypothetical protein [Exiguobacterium]|uniref:hypothetical protein n=1 Tax=Exiguobacterium TaxID=33986 RepID=UPI001BE95F1C|nr:MULTISPECIES: hypothetical protein [Exiguobacterium]MCT4777686.1 hypothetical protein [Exiguobacterium aquaticum]MCT4790003.1 hypothetical protein [Exiguobacterium mexicanum]